MKYPVYDPNWPDDVKAIYKHDMEEIWDKALAPHLWNQYHNQLNIYMSLVGKSRADILDVGCAQGTLALLLAEQGHNVTAVDIRASFLDYAHTRYAHGHIRYIAANIMTDIIPGRYDIIFANQIIEHLVYPDVLVTQLKRILKPGGRLIISTPNADYIKCTLPSYAELGDPLSWEHLQNSADGDGHFYAYKPDELRDIFHRAGFADVAVKCFDTPFISGHMKVRYFHRLVPYSVLVFLDRLVLSMPLVRVIFAYQILVVGSFPDDS
jgi:SAM-dependent methyltransferase